MAHEDEDVDEDEGVGVGVGVGVGDATSVPVPFLGMTEVLNHQNEHQNQMNNSRWPPEDGIINVKALLGMRRVRNLHSMFSQAQPGLLVQQCSRRVPLPRSIEGPHHAIINTDRVRASRRPDRAVEFHVSPYHNSSINGTKFQDNESGRSP